MKRQRPKSTGKSGKGRKRPKLAEQVIIKHKRRRRTVPNADMRDQKELVRSFDQTFRVDSSAGDLQGSTMLLHCYDMLNPWEPAFQVPEDSTKEPAGWYTNAAKTASYATIFKKYNVLALSVKLEWMPSYSDSGAGDIDSPQILAMAWDGGSLIAPETGNGYYEFVEDPRNKIIYSKGGSFKGSLTTGGTHVKGEKLFMKAYRKPIMLMDKDSRDRLFEDFPQNTDQTPVLPVDASNWNLWINILPMSVTAPVETIYYTLVIKLRWYVKMFDSVDY